LLNLRDAYHHLVSFHDANYKFMHKLYNELMVVNKRNGIRDLHEINKKLEKDQASGIYFGYTEFTKISIIQCLNHLHWICTYKFIHHRCSKQQSKADDGGKIESIKDRNGRKSKFAFHHKFKIGNNAKKKLRIGSVPSFDLEIEREQVDNFQTIVKPRAFRKREQKLEIEEVDDVDDADVLWSEQQYKSRQHKNKRSESIHLLKSKPLSSLDEDPNVDVFDLTSFDVSVLDMDIEQELD